MRWVKTLAVKQLLGEFTKLKKRLLAWSGLSVSLPVHMEQLGSQWTDFNETG
jgi:hypothetical protein